MAEGDEDAVYRPQLDNFSLYHLINEENGTSSLDSGPGLPALGHAFAGSIATASAKTLLYPLSLVVTRLQVQRQLRNKGEAESAARDADKEYDNLIDAVQKIYKTEGGLKAFYTGCAPDVAKGILDSFLFFLSYNFVRAYELKRNGGKQISLAKELGVGIAAGSLSKFFTAPIENIVTRQQTAALVAARDPNSSSTSSATVLETAKTIFNERGLAGFWSGYGENIILTTNPAITFAVDNALTRLLPTAQRNNPSPQTRFLVAALSKAIATTITYPAMLAKSRAQVPGGLGSEEEESLESESVEYLEKADLDSTHRRRQVKHGLQRVLSVFEAQYAIILALRKIYRTEGLAGLYSGVEGEVLKGFLQHGLTMMTKDKAHVVVLQTYYLLLRLTSRWPEELQKAQASASNMAGDAQKGASRFASDAQKGARDFAGDAQERIVNVGETVSEGAKRLAEKAGGSGSN